MKFSAAQLPKVTNFLLGFLFISSGAEKVMMTESMNEHIRKTKFYSLSVETFGVPLDNEKNLALFTRSLGVFMMASGAAYAANVQRALASTGMAFMVFCFTLFVHTDLDNPLQTKPSDLGVWGLNSLFMAAYLYKGGWVRGGPRMAKILGKGGRQ